MDDKLPALEEWAAEQGLPLSRLAFIGNDINDVACLGAVIRGETPHFDYVCDAVTRGVGDAVQTYKIPIGFGVLTTDDSQQAMARAGEGAKVDPRLVRTVLRGVERINAMMAARNAFYSG